MLHTTITKSLIIIGLLGLVGCAQEESDPQRSPASQDLGLDDRATKPAIEPAAKTEPTTKCLLGDANRDGKVNNLDISPAINILTAAIGSGRYVCTVDFDQDKKITLLDIHAMVEFFAPGSDDGCEKGDLNGDGVANEKDLQAFIKAVASGQYSCEADLNDDDAVNLLDVHQAPKVFGIKTPSTRK